MGPKLGKLRLGRWRVWLCLALTSIAGAAAVASRGREQYRADRGRVEKLAATPLAGAGDAPGPADWPQWRGPNRDGLAPHTSLRATWPAGGPRLVWRQPLGRGFSSVAAVGDRLYTMDEQEGEADPGREGVVCLDAATGRTVWRFGYDSAFPERFGSGPRSTPAVDGGLVYAVGPTGIFHCLRADTGVKVWRHDLLEEFQAPAPRYGVAFSPLVEGDLVYVTPGGPGGNAVAAFDKRTGRLAWKALGDPMGYSSPIVVTAAGVRQLLCLTNVALVSLSPQDGTELWRYPWEVGHGFNIATPVAFGDYVLLSSAYDKGCALLEIAREADGSRKPYRVYEHNRLRNYFASSVRLGDYLYGFDVTDLVCMRVSSGEIVWREKGGRTFGKGSLLAADGRLIVLGESGTLTLVEATPDGYRPVASARVSHNKCWTVPALAGGRLYVRDESQLCCLDLGE
jgi:outer membrane protein assembly factor BamB